MNGVIRLVSSLLLSSSLSLILGKVAASHYSLPFFSLAFPGLSPEIIFGKRLDFFEFLLTLFLSFVFFLLSNFFYSRAKTSTSALPDFFLLMSSILIFLQTHFVTSSGIQVLLLAAIIEVIYFILLRVDYKPVQSKLSDDLFLGLVNGIFLGLYFSFFAIKFSTLVISPLLIIFVIPFFVFVLRFVNYKVYNLVLSFPGVLLLTGLLFPKNLYSLTLSGLFIFLFWMVFKKSISSWNQSALAKKYLYPLGLLILIVYSPNFAFGEVDTIEEGFLMGWTQRLINGQALYRDVATFHPPFIPWTLFLFEKFVGFSLYSQRLFLHLLQIAGTIFYFLTAGNLLKKKVFIFLSVILLLSIESSLVRNNVEIRVGIGLLSLLFFFKFLDTKKYKHLLLSGALSIFGLFVSVEVGIITLLSILLGIFISFFKERKVLLKGYFAITGGVLFLLVPLSLFLAIQGALSKMMSQLSYYSSIFSQGYLNSPKERIPVLSYLHWNIVDQYFSSFTFLWDFSLWLIVGTLLYFAFQWAAARKITTGNKKLIILAFFGLLLFRIALGRSDMYHLFFVIPVMILLLFVFVERLWLQNRTSALVMVFLAFFFFGRPWVESDFLQKQIVKFERWGEVGEYKHLDFARGGGVQIGMEWTREIDSLNQMVALIKSQTKEEDTIFAYPWFPEIYFYTDKKNATSIDTPLSFITNEYQEEMLLDLREKKPSLVVYNPAFGFAGLGADLHPKVNAYINDNYQLITEYGKYRILKVAD